jgi:hypothetical protein
MTYLKTGDRILPISGIAEWIRHGSTPLPQCVRLPIDCQCAPTVPVRFLEGEIFEELTDESEVVAVSPDRQRVKVRNVETRRVSVWAIEHVELLPQEVVA